MYSHEKLNCYRKLLKLAEELGQLATSWDRGHGYLTDQIKRAMASSILNLAEGNGKRGYKKERRRFFQMSLGSISEAAACLDLAGVFNLVSKQQLKALKGELRHSYYQIRKLP